MTSPCLRVQVAAKVLVNGQHFGWLDAESTQAGSYYEVTRWVYP